MLRSALALLSLAMPALADPRSTPPVERARDDAAALVEALKARLLATPSATAALEAWCAERGIADAPRLVAHRVAGAEKTPSAEQRARLALEAGETVRYRRVRLACGAHVLSEADNWYVQDRLTPGMNAALDASDVPFGRVVRPLRPVRRNLALRMLGAPDRAGPGDPLFTLDAVLSTETGLPFCEVAETYLGAVLGPR